MSTRKGTKGKKETHFMCMVFSQHTCFCCTACLPANNTKWQEGVSDCLESEQLWGAGNWAESCWRVISALKH